MEQRGVTVRVGKGRLPFHRLLAGGGGGKHSVDSHILTLIPKNLDLPGP